MPSPVKPLLLSALLLSCALTCSTTAQAQTPSKEICLPEEQATIIGNSLQQYEKLKPAYKALRQKSQQQTLLLSQQKADLTFKAHTIAAQDSTIQKQDELLVDTDNKRALYQAKARRNGVRAILATTIAVIVLVVSLVR